ncbi:MAG TPA: hypothetical protein VF669_11895, partial [Tepidisphaeraceae bacterium]
PRPLPPIPPPPLAHKLELRVNGIPKRSDLNSEIWIGNLIIPRLRASWLAELCNVQAYVQHELARTLQPGDVVMMDKVSAPKRPLDQS